MLETKFFHWVKTYKSSYLLSDLTAGFTVGVMLIPQGMAYAMLAGMPPIYGLYCATIPLIIYALLGSSPQLAVGPVALVSLLVASSVGLLAETSSELYNQYALTLSLMVGAILLIMGLFRLGFLVNFLSHPVIAGFTSAAAIIIGVSQLKHILGIEIARGHFIDTLIATSDKLGETNLYALIIGLATMAIIYFTRQLDRRIPGALVVVILSILAVKLFHLDNHGLKLIGAVPEGMPAFTIPVMDTGIIKSLLPIAFTISFIGFMESIAVAKAIQKKRKGYDIYPNQELIALGASNFIGSFFQSYPVVGGFGRSAVNDQSGAKSGLASIISAVIIILTLLFFTTLFQKLPMAVLAAIIIGAVIGLIDFKEARHLYKTDKKDFVLFLLTAIGTLILGIEEGILLGVILSLLVVIYRASYPHIAQLGQIPGQTTYRNLNRFDELISDPSIVIIRVDARIFFANQEYVKDYIHDAIDRPEVRHLILDCIAVNGVDSSGMHMIKDLIHYLKENNIRLHLVDVKGPIRDIMQRNGIFEDNYNIGHYLTVHAAVNAIQESLGATVSGSYVFQTTKKD